jgi:hypothetical protein
MAQQLNEIAELHSTKSTLQSELESMQGANQQIRNLLEGEQRALEKSREMKREADRHYAKVLEEYRV